MGRGRAIRHLAALAAASAAVAAAGCGGERAFTASEFVEQVNEQGVTMRLGRELPSGGDADGIYAITLPPLPGEPAPPPGGEGGPGESGSLYVYDDPGGAEDRLTACRASGGLVCFRASNVVVVLDGESAGIEAQRLGVAIRRLSP